MLSRIYLLCICVLVLVACQSNLISEERKAIPQANWTFDTFMEFELNVQDTSKRYDLVLEVEHHPDFSYQNFYTKIHTIFPSGKIVNDQVSLQIGDNMGSWLGTCNSSSCRVEILLQEQFRFKEIGLHKLKIENYSRTALEQLLAFTLKLYKAPEFQ